MKANKRMAVVLAFTSVLMGGIKLGLHAQDEHVSHIAGEWWLKRAPAIVQSWTAPNVGPGGGGGSTRPGSALYQYAWTTDSSYESLWKFYADKIGHKGQDLIGFSQFGEGTNGSGDITNVLSETHRQSMFCKQSKEYTISVFLSQVKGEKPEVMLNITSP